MWGNPKVKAALALCSLALAAAPASGLDSEFSMEAGLGWGVGGAAYDLSAPIDADWDVLSRLEFPLDGWRAVAGARLTLSEAGRAVWLVEAGASLALASPVGLMRDYDWWKTSGYPPIPFSYTESRVEGSAFATEAHVARRMGGGREAGWYLAAGYLYQRAAQDVMGYTGWQYVWNGTAYELYLVEDTAKAIEYELLLHGPLVGGMCSLALGPRLALEASAFYMLVFASDRDDHILRNKLSTASGAGHGVRASLAARYSLGSGPGANGPYLSLALQALALRVDTAQRQEWYGDDPATSGYDDTGDVATGIDHIITSTQLRAELAIGTTF